MERTAPKQAAAEQKAKPVVWDCESSLYDSFELKSFERQLDSAIITARSLSMPHFIDRRAPPRDDQPHAVPVLSKKYSKISRSLQKLVRSIFRTRQSKYSSTLFRVPERPHDEVYIVFDRYGALTTIPEVPENVAATDYEYETRVSPDGRSPFVGRSASDRFSATSIGISCA